VSDVEPDGAWPGDGAKAQPHTGNSRSTLAVESDRPSCGRERRSQRADEAVKEVQPAVPESADNAPEPGTEVKAETPLEPEKQLGTDGPIKKNALEKRAPQEAGRTSNEKAGGLSGLASAKGLDEGVEGAG